MTKLRTCPSCSAFVPGESNACPCCGLAAPRPLPRFVRGVLAVGGGALMTMTLSACYGGPCAGGSCYEPYDGGLTCSDPSADLDGDGHCLAFDCDESNPDIHASAPDPEGDGVDSNCDGVDGVAAQDAGM